jgi:hypothetical protein
VDHELIDAYVGALRHSLRWRADVDDVADEAADHLRTHVDRLVASGVAADEAQRATLARFGDLATVSRSFARVSAAEAAVPTRATRAAGVVALAAGLAWVAAIVAGAAGGHTEVLTTWTLRRYEIWSTIVVGAAGLTTLAVAGVLLRVGRLRRPLGVAAVATAALVTVALEPFTWAVTVVMALFGAAVLIGLRGHPGVAHRLIRPARVLGAVWPLGAAALVLGDEVYRLGPVDAYGDHPVVWLTSFVVSAAVSASALAVIGLRLRAERAAFGGLSGTPAGASAAERPWRAKVRM